MDTIGTCILSGTNSLAPYHVVFHIDHLSEGAGTDCLLSFLCYPFTRPWHSCNVLVTHVSIISSGSPLEGVPIHYPLEGVLIHNILWKVCSYIISSGRYAHTLYPLEDVAIYYILWKVCPYIISYGRCAHTLYPLEGVPIHHILWNVCSYIISSVG